MGCASSLRQADRFFDDRFYTDAAVAYEKALKDAEGKDASVALERSLFRLAILHFLPQSPVFDKQRARQLFQQLIERFKAGPYRAQAAVILELDQQQQHLLSQAEEQQQQLAQVEGTSSNLSEDAADLRSTVGQLRQDLQRLQDEIAACQKQLDELKAIDLGDSL